MEFTNENLKKMYDKQILYNAKYSKYFFKMYLEYKNNSFLSRSNEIKNCMHYWEWEAYMLNKILDLKKVNRCKNRFCPNCKVLDISKFIHKFRQIIEDLSQQYYFYFLTLTIPSVGSSELESTLLKLNKAFSKFKKLYSFDKLTPAGNKCKEAYQDRLIDVAGGIRVLEITYNRHAGYHPHYHIFIMTEKPISPSLLDKCIIGRHSRKRDKIDFKSELESQISRIWAEVWYNTKIKKEDYHMSDVYFDKEKEYKVLEVDFREFDEKGIYETLKYTFKDTDVYNYDIFKDLYFSLYGKRIRQGFGVLYNLKIDFEDIEIGEQQNLILEIEENPITLITKNIKELLTIYKDFKKVSRKHVPIDNNIDD